MGDLSLNSTFGIKVESDPLTFAAPNTTTDLITCAELKATIQGLTADIKEFTGTIHRRGPVVLGSTIEISGKLLLRGPGGSTVPIADALVIGRILRAAGFTESIVSAAVPVAPEAVAAGGSTSSVTLGTTATGTADLYKGKMIALSALGAGKAGLTMVKSNDAAKLAQLPEVAGGALTTGTWQLIKQIAYIFSNSAGPTLSSSVWLGKQRIDAGGLAVSSFKVNMPTSSKEGQDVPSIDFTLTGDIVTWADDTAPVPAAALAVPPFRDGKMWVANTQLGGSSFTIDFGMKVAFPPNPNRLTGSEPAQMVETTRKVDLTLNQVPLATWNHVTQAQGQGYYSLYALWGLGVGNAFGLLVPEMRFNFRSPDNSGDFVTTTGEAYIDTADKAISLVFAFPSTF